MVAQCLHKVDDDIKLVQEPAIDASEIVEMVDGIASLQGSCHCKYSLVSWVGQILGMKKETHYIVTGNQTTNSKECKIFSTIAKPCETYFHTKGKKSLQTS